MTATLTQKDSIGLLRDAYENKYPNLLSKLGIDLIGFYSSKNEDTKFISDLPMFLHNANMSDYSDTFKTNADYFATSLSQAIIRIADSRSISLSALYSFLVFEDSYYKNTPMKANSSKTFDIYNSFFASALDNKIENDEIIDLDIEKAIRLFNISNALGAGYCKLIGLTSYFEAKMIFPGDFLVHQAIFLTREDAINFLAKRILEFEPNFIYQDFQYNPDSFPSMSGLSEEKYSGVKRSAFEIINVFNRIPPRSVYKSYNILDKEFQAIINEFPLF